jgi:hypothetical protein
VRSKMARMTTAESSSTGTERRVPPKVPTAVRTGLTIAARLIVFPYINLRGQKPVVAQSQIFVFYSMVYLVPIFG